jgi:hypothetical protein
VKKTRLIFFVLVHRSPWPTEPFSFHTPPNQLTMSGTDQRCIVGARVNAKALQVSNLAECTRRYGSNAKTKRVGGTVVSFELLSLPGKARKSCFITADYDLGGGVVKRCRLNIRSLSAGDITTSTETTGTQLMTQNITAVATATAPVVATTTAPVVVTTTTPVAAAVMQQHDDESMDSSTTITPRQLETTQQHHPS